VGTGYIDYADHQEITSMRWADVIQDEPIRAEPPISGSQRAGLVIVGIYYLVPAVWGLLLNILLQTGTLKAPAEMQDVMRNMSIWQWVLGYATLGLNLAGGGLLLGRYRLALPVLLVSAGVVALNLLYLVATGQFPPPNLPIALTLLPYPFLIAAVAYVYVLHRRGILYKRLSS
jgi:hypothetical protein